MRPRPPIEPPNLAERVRLKMIWFGTPSAFQTSFSELRTSHGRALWCNKILPMGWSTKPPTIRMSGFLRVWGQHLPFHAVPCSPLRLLHTGRAHRRHPPASSDGAQPDPTRARARRHVRCKAPQGHVSLSQVLTASCHDERSSSFNLKYCLNHAARRPIMVTHPLT